MTFTDRIYSMSHRELLRLHSRFHMVIANRSDRFWGNYMVTLRLKEVREAIDLRYGRIGDKRPVSVAAE